MWLPLGHRQQRTYSRSTPTHMRPDVAVHFVDGQFELPILNQQAHSSEGKETTRTKVQLMDPSELLHLGEIAIQLCACSYNPPQQMATIAK